MHANGAKPLVAGQSAGTLINDFQVRASGVDGTAYLVSYWSQTYLNQPVVVTGIVYVPSGTAPAGGWPAVTYAHGTDGMTADCGPSDDPSSGVPDVNSLLDQGWEVVATDYQGETDTDIASAVNELQPHGVSMPTAEDVIDMVRAARQIPAAHASANYVAWGFSQGARRSPSWRPSRRRTPLNSISSAWSAPLPLRRSSTTSTGTRPRRCRRSP